MKNFYVKITETLSKTVHIEADSREEALGKVIAMYKNEDIVLCSEDYDDVTLNVVGEELSND